MGKGRKGRSRRDHVDRYVCLVHDTWRARRRRRRGKKQGPIKKDTNADFKKDLRKIKKYAVPEEQEWVLETAYGNKHRLKGVAIGSRQAAIRGRPKAGNEDAHMIMKIILAIRGLDKKIHIKEREEGRLSVMPKKMKMQSIALIWRTAVEKGERWNEEEQGKVEEETMPLKDILCPACGSTQKTRDMKLRVKTPR